MKEEFEWAKEVGMNLYKFDVLEPLKEVLPKLAGRPVYVTIDIDVLDPAHAPGTGTLEAGGITSKGIRFHRGNCKFKYKCSWSRLSRSSSCLRP